MLSPHWLLTCYSRLPIYAKRNATSKIKSRVPVLLPRKVAAARQQPLSVA